MTELITTFGPLLALMLIPLWIPLMAAAFSAVAGLVTRRERSSVAKHRQTARAASATAQAA